MRNAKQYRLIAKLLINYIVKMRAAKKRKVDGECRVFKKECTTKNFFTEVGSTAVCLTCQKNVAVVKEYNIRRHFDTNHANYRSSLSTQQREVTSQRLVTNFRIQQNTLFQQSAVHESITKTSFFWLSNSTSKQTTFRWRIYQAVHGWDSRSLVSRYKKQIWTNQFITQNSNSPYRTNWWALR